MNKKSAVIGMLMFLFLAFGIPSAHASLGASISQSGITITQNFSSVYYVDTKASPYPKGFYAAYNVANTTNADFADVWVTLGSFTGSTVYLSLGGNDTGVVHLGKLAAHANKTAFVFLKVDCSSFTSGNCNISAAQGLTVDVYLGIPAAGYLLASLTTNDITVYDTISAGANKVNSGSVSTTTPSVGSTFTVTVNGSTGTIGGSNIFALTPEGDISFPANSFKLTGTSITFSNGGTGTYTDLLQIPTSVISGIPSTDYTVTYTYFVSGTTSTTTSVQPVAYINSGTQIKHTDISSFGNIPAVQPASNTLTLSMAVSPTALGVSGGTVTYTVHVTNSGSTAASLDQFIDALASSPAAENYVTASSTFAGNNIADPTISGNTLIWAGTFTVPANGSADLSFQTTIPGTLGTYTDYFYGLVSASHIDTTLSTSDDAKATTSVTVSSQQSTTIAISNIPASAIYGGSFTPTFAYTGDGTASVSSNSTSVCTVTGGVVHYVGVGTCSLTASATAGTNYLATTGAAQAFSVGQATPTISISNLPASGSYSGSFTPTFSYTGDGTTSVSSNSTSVCTVNSGVVHYVGTGTCSLTASATAGTNYAAVTGTAQTFSVGQATPTISISNLPVSGSYGGSFTPSFSYTGDGTTSVSSNATSVCTVTSGVVHYVGVGTCSLTASAAAGTNYSAVTGTAQAFSVGQATPTISISNLPTSGSYGGSFTPTFSYTGDGTASVNSNSTSVCTVTSGVVHYVGVGTCSLTASATAGTNYAAVTGTAQTFSVGQAAPTISISNLPASGSYGGSFTPMFSYTGDGTASVNSNSTSVCTVTSGVVHYVGVGTCSLTASATAGNNYAAVTGTAQTFSVGQATPTISVSNLPASGTYGGTFMPTFSYTGDGTASISSSTPNVCTAIDGVVHLVGAGTCTLTASASAGTDYAAVTGSTQSFTVGQATASVTLSNLNLIYTGSPQGGTVTTSPSGLSVNVTYNGSTTAPAAVGNYTIVATISDSNYSGTATGVLVISKASATIVLGGLNQTYTGSPLSATSTTNPTGLNLTLTYDGSPTAPTAAGSYIVVGTINDSNYQGSATGTMLISKVQPSIIWAAPQAIVYGTPLSAMQLNASVAGVPGTFVYTPSAGTVLPAGLNQVLSVTFTPNDTTNYGTASQTVQISVDQAAAGVTLGSSTNPALLQNPITFTARVSAAAGTPTGSVSFMNGTTLLGTGTLSGGVATFTASSLAIGTYSITALYSGDANFVGSNSGAVSQTVIDFSLASTSGAGSGSNGNSGSGSQVVPPGGSATYTVAIMPTAGAGFPTTTLLTVTGLPAGATATLNTAGWTELTGTSWSLPALAQVGDVSLTFQLPKQTAAAMQNEKQLLSNRLPAVWAVFLFLPFACKLRRAGKRFRSLVPVFILTLASLAIAGLSGCGANSNGFFGTKPQNYTITITVTTGALSHSTDVTLEME